MQRCRGVSNPNLAASVQVWESGHLLGSESPLCVSRSSGSTVAAEAQREKLNPSSTLPSRPTSHPSRAHWQTGSDHRGQGQERCLLKSSQVCPRLGGREPHRRTCYGRMHGAARVLHTTSQTAFPALCSKVKFKLPKATHSPWSSAPTRPKVAHNPFHTQCGRAVPAWRFCTVDMPSVPTDATSSISTWNVLLTL